MNASETEIIIEHALISEANMVLAAKVGGAFKHLQQRVIHRFLERLQDELRGAFGSDWSVELETKERGSPYLYARRSSWPEAVNFGIRSDNGCISWVYIYVTKCGGTFPNGSVDQELEEALAELGRWKISDHLHFAYPDKHRNWGEQETLVDLYRANEALEYVKALLIRTRDAVAPIIDRNVSR